MPALARKFRVEPEPSPKRSHRPERAPDAAFKQRQRRRKVFHASVMVTRLEEWFVEADSAEEARALIAAGEGHRSSSGERVHVEIERLLEGRE